MTAALPIIAFLAVVLFISAFAAYSFRQENRRLSDQLAYYRRTYLSHQGGGSLTAPIYHLASFDGGLTWFNVTRSGTGLTIVSPADPDLVSRIEALDRLVEHARTHGPIGSHPVTEADIKALTDAGFTVQSPD